MSNTFYNIFYFLPNTAIIGHFVIHNLYPTFQVFYTAYTKFHLGKKKPPSRNQGESQVFCDFEVGWLRGFEPPTSGTTNLPSRLKIYVVFITYTLLYTRYIYLIIILFIHKNYTKSFFAKLFLSVLFVKNYECLDQLLSLQRVKLVE